MSDLFNRESVIPSFLAADPSILEDLGDHRFIMALDGDFAGIQGLNGHKVIPHVGGNMTVLRFEDVIGGTLLDLDDNVDTVVDSGASLTFIFTGGGSLTLMGVSGYEDFMSLSIDYSIEVFA